ncbi:hypothetical protein P7K49_006951, partial [Saguinus oedipus]
MVHHYRVSLPLLRQSNITKADLCATSFQCDSSKNFSHIYCEPQKGKAFKHSFKDQYGCK